MDIGIHLFWLPLGAGGRFVRLNGRIYEGISARRERRPALDLYHSALQVVIPEGTFVVENAWPIPDGSPEARGVTVEGPVWGHALGRFRVFRYEIRRWPDGTIADADEAVASPVLVSDDATVAQRLLDLTTEVPTFIWGRDELGLGEMWNSNSVISWLLTRSGIPAAAIDPPPGGRAPGWTTGAIVAELTERVRGVPSAPLRIGAGNRCDTSWGK